MLNILKYSFFFGSLPARAIFQILKVLAGKTNKFNLNTYTWFYLVYSRDELTIWIWNKTWGIRGHSNLTFAWKEYGDTWYFSKTSRGGCFCFSNYSLLKSLGLWSVIIFFCIPNLQFLFLSKNLEQYLWMNIFLSQASL